MSQHIGADAEQLIQQRIRQVALENGSWEKIEDLQAAGKNCTASCQRQLELTVHSDENCPIGDSAPDVAHHPGLNITGRLKPMSLHSQITVQRYLGSKRTSMVVQEVSVTFFPWGTLL